MSSSQNVFNKIAAHAKAHHASVNAAYSTFYSGGVSPLPPTTMPARQSSTSSTSSTSSLNKAWTSLKKHAKEHHEGVNAAYATYYGAGASSTSSAASTPAASPRSSMEGKPRMSVEKVASGLKKAAKEHHRSANAAFQTYYGA